MDIVAMMAVFSAVLFISVSGFLDVYMLRNMLTVSFLLMRIPRIRGAVYVDCFYSQDVLLHDERGTFS